MSEKSQRYEVDETNETDVPGKRTLTTEGGVIFIWGDDGTVEICVPVTDMPNPQQMASMQVPLADVLEFVAKGVVLPVRRTLLEQLSDVELLLGEVPGAAPPAPPEQEDQALVSREHPTTRIRRPGN